MNKEQLEKMFDDKFYDNFWSMRWVAPIATISEIKQFIFETIIPEVLNSVIPKEFTILNTIYAEWHNDCLDNIKQKALNLYNITL